MSICGRGTAPEDPADEKTKSLLPLLLSRSLSSHQLLSLSSISFASIWPITSATSTTSCKERYRRRSRRVIRDGERVSFIESVWIASTNESRVSRLRRSVCRTNVRVFVFNEVRVVSREEMPFSHRRIFDDFKRCKLLRFHDFLLAGFFAVPRSFRFGSGFSSLFGIGFWRFSRLYTVDRFR